MVTRYTNIVLTVIAAALCAIAYQNATTWAYAGEASCGSYSNPCYVRAETGAGLDVKVTNWPQGLN
jgi:hypothetical protein